MDPGGLEVDIGKSQREYLVNVQAATNLGLALSAKAALRLLSRLAATILIPEVCKPSPRFTSLQTNISSPIFAYAIQQE